MPVLREFQCWLQQLHRQLHKRLDQRHLGGRDGLLGRQGWRDWRRIFAAWSRDADGRLPASFEIVFGHAWKPEPRQIADGRAVIRFQSR